MRFMRKGTTRIFWVPSIDDEDLAPAVSEVTGGTELTPELAEINGFNFSNSPIDTPDMGTSFVSKIPGEDTVGDSDMSFYEHTDSNPIKTALAKGTTGNVVIFYAGTDADDPAAADECDVWPATVASNSRSYSAGNEAAMYQIVFTLTSEPVTETAVIA